MFLIGNYVLTTIIYLLLIFDSTKLVNGDCWKEGTDWYPSFDSAPNVTQISISSVQVSWKGIVQNVECAHYVKVKYWETGSDNACKRRFEDFCYESPGFEPNTDFVIIPIVTQKISYTFQVLIRFGPKLGPDYIVSPMVKVTMSPFAPKDNSPSIIGTEVIT